MCGCEWRRPSMERLRARRRQCQISLPVAIPMRRRFRNEMVWGRGSAPVRAGQSPATTHSSSSWRDNIAFKAMGWGLKESCDRLQLLAGDRLDIAYSLGMNDHPEFGGLELTLRDVVRSR